MDTIMQLAAEGEMKFSLGWVIWFGVIGAGCAWGLRRIFRGPRN